MDIENFSSERIIKIARRVLVAEGKAVLSTASQIDQPFCRLVELIRKTQGRVVMTGVGKSGIIATKIAATLASTGTPAFFLKPLDAVHGDLGMIDSKDLLLAISNSGETQEILNVVFAAKKLGAKIGLITGDPKSTLSQESDIVLCIKVEREACPLGLAPTTSTTVVLAVGDALALTLLELSEFSSKDYARFHPGGSLGRRLSLLVRDFMRTGEKIPLVSESDSLHLAIDTMTQKERLGVTLICNPKGILTGILTDGDLRRILIKEPELSNILSRPVKAFMTHDPLTIESETRASEALRIMEVKGITSLAIINSNGEPEGIVHLHDILGRSKFYL